MCRRFFRYVAPELNHNIVLPWCVRLSSDLDQMCFCVVWLLPQHLVETALVDLLLYGRGTIPDRPALLQRNIDLSFERVAVVGNLLGDDMPWSWVVLIHSQLSECRYRTPLLLWTVSARPARFIRWIRWCGFNGKLCSKYLAYTTLNSSELYCVPLHETSFRYATFIEDPLRWLVTTLELAMLTFRTIGNLLWWLATMPFKWNRLVVRVCHACFGR